METPFKPEWWDEKITKLGGTNYKGWPNLRTVWAPNERKWNGSYKYPNPEIYSKSMEMWILEVWYPPQWFEPIEKWNAEVAGPFPYDGLYGMKTPLMTGDGKMLQLNDSTFEAIQRKQLADLEWKAMDALERFNFINEQQAEQERMSQEAASKDYHAELDQYYHHAEHEVNADNRLWLFPKHLQPEGKGSRRSIQDK